MYTLCMNTKFVGIKEFRKNIAKYARESLETRHIIVSHNKPIFEIKPFDKVESLDSLFEAILEAKEDVAAGRVHSHEEVLKMLS